MDESGVASRFQDLGCKRVSIGLLGFRNVLHNVARNRVPQGELGVIQLDLLAMFLRDGTISESDRIARIHGKVFCLVTICQVNF